jgi:Zinc carboxypeptidase
MTAMYIIHELVEHDYEFPDILDQVDIVVVPVANPGEETYTPN